MVRGHGLWTTRPAAVSEGEVGGEAGRRPSGELEHTTVRWRSPDAALAVTWEYAVEPGPWVAVGDPGLFAPLLQPAPRRLSASGHRLRHMPARLLRSLRSPRAILNVLLVLVLLVAAGGAYLLLDDDESAAAPATTEVARGNVVSMVSATGNVVAARDVGVDFASGGEVTSVRVDLGDRVRQGQVLATVENADAVDQRDTAQASYDQAAANLRLLTDGATEDDLAAGDASVRQAAATVDSAEQALADARKVERTNRRVYDDQVRGAQRNVAQADDDRARAQDDLATARTALREAEQGERAACAASPDGTTGPGSTACTSAQSATASAEQAVATAETAVTTADTTLDTARDAVTTAEQNRSVGNVQQQQSVGSAASSLGSARASYDYTVATARQAVQPATDAEVDASRAQVDSARISLTSAERGVADTVLRAPADGVVASISGSVGEYTSGSGGAAGATTDGGTTSGDTGSTGGDTGGATGGAGATAESSASTSGGAGSSGDATGFVVLTEVDGLQVEADFSEADVSRVALGRGASVSFEALDNAGVDSGTNASITGIAPTSSVADNVVTYEVYATLDAPPKRLKVGQTATLDVVLDEAQDVLQVPTSAVTTTGDTSTVSVVVGGKEEQRTVEVGVEGDATTEILSGLEEGDQVVTSSGGGLGGFPGGELPELPGGGGLG